MAYRVVVIRLILNQWVIPAVADQDALERDFVCSLNVLRILCFKVFIVNRPIVPSVALGGEVEAMSRVLRKDAHKSLQSLPEAWSSLWCRGDGQALIRIRICATAPVSCIFWTRVAR
jgi:hypothetical protein